MSLGLHPIVLAAIFGVILTLIIVVFAIRSRSSATRMLLALLAVILLVPAGIVVVGLNPWLVDARFRAYRGFYRDIEIGMTREQVMEIVQRHYPTGGPRGIPKVMEASVTSLGFFMDPESSREPNCEGIFLTMTGDRVTKIDYSAD